VAYWLLKTEPGTYSYSDLEKDGTTVWDGVSNNLALKHIRMMKKGDLAFVYHTGDQKAITGVAEIASDPFPDPGRKDPRLVVFRLKAKQAVNNPVPLSEIRQRKELGTFPLVRLPRLSVMPVAASEWKLLTGMAR